MTGDPGAGAPPTRWEVRLVVTYLMVIRCAVKCRVLPLSWALRLVAPVRATPDPSGRQGEQEVST